MSDLSLISVLVPVVGGVLLPVLAPVNKRSLSRNIYVLAVTVMTFMSVLMCSMQNTRSLHLWDMTEGLSICLNADLLGKMFALLTAFVWVVNGIYSFAYMKEEEHLTCYYTNFLLALGSMIGISFAGNLITMYLFYEMMTLTTLCLVLHERTKEAVDAGKKYLFYSVGGAFLGLFLFFVLYQYADTLSFVPGGVLDAGKTAGHETLILIAALLALIGFGAKAGMFPLHGWLPTAHPVAPAPASAVLSGNITKMGVFVIIRIIFYLVGTDFLRGTFVQYVFMAFALLTVLMGSMMAYMEEGFKKRLAYSTVSQVSYILFGLSLMNTAGFVGALMHVVFHSLVKNTLFLNAGAVIHQTGKTKVSMLTGIGKEMPVTMWCFTLVSLTLVGIPPTSAFLSKWYLAEGALSSGLPVFSYLGPVILLVSALLTAGYLITITMKGFFPGDGFDYAGFKKKEAGLFMTAPMALLTAGAVLLGMFPTEFIKIVEAIATLAVR